MEIAIRDESCTSRSGDELSIARVQVATWRTTYAGIVPQAHLNSLSVGKRAEMWARAISPTRGAGTNFVATDADGQIVGFVDVGPSRTPEFSYQGELNAIYLLKEFQGQGVGKKLVEAAMDWLQSNNLLSMFLWVIKENPAKGFYEHIGGRVFSSKIVEIGGVQIEEVALGWGQLHCRLHGRLEA